MTRKKLKCRAAEEELRIVLLGMESEIEVSECRCEGIKPGRIDISQ